MPDATYQPKIYHKQGGDELVVASGGKITNDGTQAAASAALTAASGTADGTVADVGAAFSQATLNDNFQECATKINAILAALRGVGIIAP